MSQEERFQAELEAKKVDAESMVSLILTDLNLIDRVLQELSNKVPRVKFACSKSLLLLSERCPDLLYTRIEKVFELLESGNQILKWNAIAMLGNLAAVDRNRRIRRVLRKFYQFLSGGELITANNTISALAKIGCAFPEEQGRITSRLFGIEHAVFDTDECRNIAIGKSILAMEMFVNPVKVRKEVLEFVRRQTENKRKATANKAKAFMRKYE